MPLNSRLNGYVGKLFVYGVGQTKYQLNFELLRRTCYSKLIKERDGVKHLSCLVVNNKKHKLKKKNQSYQVVNGKSVFN